VHSERFFYTSDFRGNASAIVSSGGNLIEQYRYPATGVPFGIARGDVNADGVVGTPGGGGGGTVAAFTATSNADYDQAEYLVKNNIYEVRADWNLDGKINAIDTAVAAAAVGTATGRKTMSAVGVGNFIDFELRISHTATIVSVLVLTSIQEASLTAYYYPQPDLSLTDRDKCRAAQPPPQGPHYAICVPGSNGGCNKLYCPSNSAAPPPTGAAAVLENCERDARRSTYNSFLTCGSQDREGKCVSTPNFINPETGLEPSTKLLEKLNCTYHRALTSCLLQKYEILCMGRGPGSLRYLEPIPKPS
jgi:hypothetical protein